MAALPTFARRATWVLDLIVAALAIAVALALLRTSLGRVLEFETFDLVTTAAAPYESASPIVVVAIDEPTFQQLALPWPFPLRTHANLVDRAAADGAKVIAFDLQFSEASGATDEALFAAAIARAGNVVLAKSRVLEETTNARQWIEVEPLPSLIAAGARAGDAGVEPDADNVVRLFPTATDALAREIAARAGGTVPAEREDRPRLLRYAGPRGTFQTIHYYQAVTPGLLPPGFFRGRIVLVGRAVLASPELQQTDVFNSPFLATERRLMPGVVIHANAVANLLEGQARYPLQGGGEALVVLAACAAVGVAGRRRSPLGAAGVLAAVVVVLAVVAWAAFAYGSTYVSPLFATLAAAGLWVGQTAVNVVFERRRVQETRRAFAQYVPPEVVDRLIDRPELLALGGETRELTLLFADLANFTSLSEAMTPAETVALLTEYLDAMSMVIHRHRGTVDKYIGDGIMAFWGAPLPDDAHALHAVEAALEMQREFATFARAWVARGAGGGAAAEAGALAMRIGLHTGPVVVGNVGSRARFAYTAIGDAVNLASRLEGANKAFGTSILVSDATAAQLPPTLALRPVDAVIVKGRRDPVTVFTPCDDAALVEATAAARAALAAGRVDAARAAWAAIAARWPADPVAPRAVERLERLAALPEAQRGGGPLALDKL